MATRPITPETAEQPPIVPPEMPDNKVAAFIRKQPKQTKIALLVVLVIGIVLVIILSYASLFKKHSTSHTHKTTSHASKSSSKTLGASTTKKSSSSSKTTPPVSSNTGVSKTHPAPSSHAAGGPAAYPASILNLTNWKLTLPISTSGSSTAEEIDQPQLATYALAPYFQADAANDGVEFLAPVDGAKTSGSNFPRSELREMTDNGQQEASWSTNSGTSTMTVREAITHVPAVRSQVVAAQVHGPSAYVILIRLDGSDLFVEGDNGADLGDLNTNYKLGTIFTVQIVASGGHILVYYNGVQKANDTNSTSGDYFKAGCYTQSNPSYGDSPTDYGQVIIYGLSVSHA